MEADILLFFQTQWRFKGSDSLPSNHIFFLASKVVCGLFAFKKKKKKSHWFNSLFSQQHFENKKQLPKCMFFPSSNSITFTVSPELWSRGRHDDDKVTRQGLCPQDVYGLRGRQTHTHTDTLTRLWLVLWWRASHAVGTGRGERISPGRYGKVFQGCGIWADVYRMGSIGAEKEWRVGQCGHKQINAWLVWSCQVSPGAQLQLLRRYGESFWVVLDNNMSCLGFSHLKIWDVEDLGGGFSNIWHFASGRMVTM